jgi:hypothetical protein
MRRELNVAVVFAIFEEEGHEVFTICHFVDTTVE